MFLSTEDSRFINYHCTTLVSIRFILCEIDDVIFAIHKKQEKVVSMVPEIQGTT